jgi:hypothetical protein
VLQANAKGHAARQQVSGMLLVEEAAAATVIQGLLTSTHTRRDTAIQLEEEFDNWEAAAWTFRELASLSQAAGDGIAKADLYAAQRGEAIPL